MRLIHAHPRRTTTQGETYAPRGFGGAIPNELTSYTMLSCNEAWLARASVHKSASPNGITSANAPKKAERRPPPIDHPALGRPGPCIYAWRSQGRMPAQIWHHCGAGINTIPKGWRPSEARWDSQV